MNETIDPLDSLLNSTNPADRPPWVEEDERADEADNLNDDEGGY